MRIRKLHPWQVTPKEAIAIQRKLKSKVRIRRCLLKPKIIAGADLSFFKSTSKAVVGIVLLNYSTLEVLGEFIKEGIVNFPYIPGLLSFREGSLILDLFKKVTPEPDLIFFYCQGIAHPRGLDLGSHIGLFLNKPSIGCAKSKLIGSFNEPGINKGNWTPLKDDKGRTLGAALRSKEKCKPIFVSAGHLIDLDQSIEWTLQCTSKHKIPEPTRQAHRLVTNFRQNQ